MATSVAHAVSGNLAVQISAGPKHVVIQNLGPYNIYLGGSGVTISNGLQVNPDQALFPIPVGLLTLESIYAIAASEAEDNTSDVRVLSFTG